ncbi:LysR family transcriptional regulator [Nitratireductor sp. GISD-1A_MAKvit]|uniref:LysR family transcriptional regulator n=1 Tax=Nitratireductor sp. GISD-1A_MAKvit TaxID=3234198 RepID=UPI003464F158
MRLALLQTFQAIIETGTTQGAANKLGLSQSAVSRRLTQLEETLKIKLFLRDKTRLIPTRDSRILQGQMQLLLQRSEKLLTLAEELRQGNSPAIRLRLAFPASLTLSIVPAIIREFLVQSPMVQVELHSGSYDTIERMLLDERAELGFLRMPVQKGGLVETPLVQVNTVCVLPQDHPLAVESEIDVRDLADEPLILLGRLRAPRHEIDTLFSQYRIRPNVRLEAHSVLSACGMAAAGLGVTLVNEMMARDYAHMPVVIRRLKQNITHRFAMARPEEVPLTDAAQIFLNTTVSFLERHFSTLQTGQLFDHRAET